MDVFYSCTSDLISGKLDSCHFAPMILCAFPMRKARLSISLMLRYCRIGLRYRSAITSGPHGVEGRAPSLAGLVIGGVSITDPFVLYQNYVKLGYIERDEQQLRTMKEFQKLYYRLIDYKAPDEVQVRINVLLKKLELKYIELEHPVNKIIHRVFANSGPDAEKRQLIKYMTDEEELESIGTPQGLLLNGDVGCGKSMLMDIFAQSLPHSSKMRWHYHNFILWVFTEMHRLQQERNVRSTTLHTMENEFILFEIAQAMITKNTILILDEFMLPDIASANIIKILFTFYFKLGGVLVATSNKLPEELYSNEFHKQKFKSFVNILHSRCQSVDMKAHTDYREVLSNYDTHRNLYVGFDNEDAWQKLIKPVIGDDAPVPSSVWVYGRNINIPKTYGDGTVCYFDYDHVCQGLFASSDYISITSKFQTIIIDKVPIMTMKMKNEAKRFITFLDSIYESKCQFYMRSQVDLEYLFFPDVFHQDNEEISALVAESNKSNDLLEVQEEEMFAKTRIALDSPYRPNVSSYDSETTETYVEPVEKVEQGVGDMRAFTGEDEQFAYKRAILRIKEMVGSPLWRKNQWVVLDSSMRPWEVSTETKSRPRPQYTTTDAPDIQIENIRTLHPKKKVALVKENLPRDVSHLKNIPFSKFNKEISPTIENNNHFWAMGDWTNKQGQRLKDSLARAWIRLGIRK